MADGRSRARSHTTTSDLIAESPHDVATATIESDVEFFHVLLAERVRDVGPQPVADGVASPVGRYEGTADLKESLSGDHEDALVAHVVNRELDQLLQIHPQVRGYQRN